MATKALLNKARRRAARKNRMQRARESLHRRRLKLDSVEAKLRARLRNVESLQSLLADRYNGLVYAISQLE